MVIMEAMSVTGRTNVKIDSTAKTLPIDREAERYPAIALAPLHLNL